MTEVLTDSQVLARKIRNFINDRRDNKEVKLLKDKPDKKGRGGINAKLITFLDSKSTDDLNIQEQLNQIKKEKKAKDLSTIEFEQQKYQKLLAFTAGMAYEIVGEYAEILGEINDAHDSAAWIAWAAANAKGRSLATHVIKLTNSSIPPDISNIYDKTNSIKHKYLSTSTIKNLVIDGTGNAAFAPITSLLEIQHEGKMLADYIIQNDGCPLLEFSESEEQIDEWLSGLKKAVDTPEKSSHYLAKQIYFPVPGNDYNLLLPMISSSMAQALFAKFKDYSYEAQKKSIERKSKNLYAQETIISFPNRAVIKVTASQHQNASSLNGKRGGRLSLLSSRPPLWKSTTKLPSKVESLFDGEVRYLVRNELLELRKFLIFIKKKELNRKAPNLHKQLLTLIDTVTDRLFSYVSTIQQLTKHAGWSAQSKLKLSHQLWLDPLREDEGFQQQFNSTDWQEEICSDFAAWLNKSLSTKKLVLSQAQETFWMKIMQQRLREFEAIREVQV